MLEKKIKLNNAIRKLISDSRKAAKESRSELTADYISEHIGRAKSWLSQVENGRLQTVKSEDLINVFTIIKNTNYETAKDYIDNQVSDIYAQIKNNIADEDGNIINFEEYLMFSQTRGYLCFATKKFNIYVKNLKTDTTNQLKDDLKHIIRNWTNNVVKWINRAFPNTNVLFNDEVSLTNLYFILESSYQILDRNYDFYGLNPPNITVEELNYLKDKLNDSDIVIPRTTIKPLNSYSNHELDKVIQYYHTEDYLQWKNHGMYLGDDPFPLLINYKFSLDDKDSFKFYKDITTQTGLSEKQYLHIIKQLCYLLDCIYVKCRDYINFYNETNEESTDLFEQVKHLKEENEALKKQIENLKNNSLPD